MTEQVLDSIKYEGMSVDVEGVSDVAAHSKMAIAAFLLLIAGCLAPIEPRLAFLTGLATLLGALVLVFHRRVQYSGAAINLACFAVLVGSFLTAWGVTTFQTSRMRMFDKATAVAAKYLEVLSKGQMLDAIQMVGLEPMVADLAEDELTPPQKAVRFYLEDYTLNQVIKRGQDAKWVSKGIVEHYRQRDGYVYKIRFNDETRDHPLPFDVVVVHVPPHKYASEKLDRWKIDRLEQPPQ